MTKKSDTPAIRFKGFTDTWEQRKLGGMASLITKGTTPLDKSNTGVVNFVKIESIDESSGNITITQKISLDEHNGYLHRSQLKENDILFSIAGTLGRVTSVKSSILPANTNQALAIIRLKDGCLDYVKTYLKGKAVADFIKKNPTIGAQPNLSLEQVANLEIAIPSEDEQKKIGAFFQQLDNLITLHQRKYDKLTNVKKSMLEKMFPKNGSNVPEIRFKGFTEAWEQRKLTEFVEFFSGLTYTPNDVQENGTLVLRSSNVSNGEVVDADNIYVNPQVVNSENVKVGDIVVVVRNGSRSLIGKHAQIKAFMPNTVIGAFMTGIRSECPEFTNALLNTSRFEEEIAMNMGATINQITGYMFSKMEFKVPCLDEQKKIGEYFEKLDNLITLHQRELEKLKNIKKSCLENMFV